MTKQYKKVYTVTVDITPELLHRLNEILAYDDESVSEDPDNLTPYETSLVISLLDELWEDLDDEDKWNIKGETVKMLS